MSSATLRVGVGPTAVPSHVGAFTRWTELAPLGVPCVLLLLGGGVAYAFTLDARVAAERLIGLAAGAVVALAAVVGLRHLARPSPALVAAAVLALAGGVWIVAATGPDVFRGSVGNVLNVAFRPLFGLVRVTDPIEVANTRFIIGYNGLADLCLVAIFCGSAVLLQRPRAWLLGGVVGVGLVLLVGTGARGGLTGLAAGICAIGIVLWPRRLVALSLVAAPLALLVATIGVLDKGLEFSSTAGRLTYWSDLARMLVEYPLTGVGLGLDTAFKATLTYQINPDPERIFYAHNTFVQSYLEMGPLGMLGMLALPLVGLLAAAAARTRGFDPARRPLLVAGLGIVGALEAHGLTDQVVTTNVGTLFVLLGLAAVLASLAPAAADLVARWTRGLAIATLAVGVVVALGVAVWPAARAQALLDLGSLRVNQSLVLDRQSPLRPAALSSAEATLRAALANDPGHPAVLRELVSVRAAQFDDTEASRGLAALAQSSRLDAFDMLQIARLYRDVGLADEAYAWAARAYTAWGRAPEDAVMQGYAQATLSDSRAQNLAEQAEAAMRARHFSEAQGLFEQALTFEPTSAYLHDRVGAAERAVAKYGG